MDYKVILQKPEDREETNKDSVYVCFQHSPYLEKNAKKTENIN